MTGQIIKAGSRKKLVKELKRPISVLSDQPTYIGDYGLSYVLYDVYEQIVETLTDAQVQAFLDIIEKGDQED